jgi:hypothetical protein
LIAHLPNMDIIQRNQAQSRAIRRHLSTVWPSGSQSGAIRRNQGPSDAISVPSGRVARIAQRPPESPHR